MKSLPKLIICRGSPASGKTTVTRQRTAASNGTMKRICKDNLRDMMDTNHHFGLKHMNQYNELITQMMFICLQQSFDVIIDETFTRRKDILRIVLEYLTFCEQYDIIPSFEILDFTAVPFDELVLRDKARNPSLGFAVLDEYREDFIREGTTEEIVDHIEYLHDLKVIITKMTGGKSV